MTSGAMTPAPSEGSIDGQKVVHVDPSSPPADPRAKFQVGTLRYTGAGLATLFIWMLWGDFCYTLMETVTPAILPLKLRSLGASNVYVGILMTALPSGMNFLVNPVVSFRSDRYRSRWGRRIPFLAVATPFITLFLALMAFAEPLGTSLHATALGRYLADSPQAFTLGLLGVVLVGFQFFNMIISSVYYYLFNDVVPEAFLGRFAALFRIVATLAGFCFNMFVFAHAQTHMREIFLGAAGLYFVGFALMCWRVKEGDYPPPPPNIGGRTGLLAAAQTYLKESFSHRIYVFFFSFNALSQASAASVAFTTFFVLSLGISLEQMGKALAWFAVPRMLLLYPAGWVVDRVGAVRLLVVVQLLLLVLAPLEIAFARGFNTWVLFAMAAFPLHTMNSALLLPLYMTTLPKERYGQFGSADAMVRSVATVCAGVGVGYFMDAMKRAFGGDESYYRFTLVWAFVFQALAFVPLLLFYREWRRHGGGTPAGYVAPAPETTSAVAT
jgi:maltose/moltooligosaccharide transporter